MRLETLLPAKVVLPEVGQAMQRGNPALAAATVAAVLESTEQIDTARRVELLIQGAVAARLAGHQEQAQQWARDSVMLSADVDPQTVALALGLAVFADAPQSQEDALALAQRIESALVDISTESVAAFSRYAAVVAYILGGDTAAAREALNRLQALPAARGLWIAGRSQVCAAVIDYLEASPAGVASTLDLLQPFTLSAGDAIPLASMWWDMAELWHRLGNDEAAWTAAVRALDASGVRPADGHSSFAPGVLTWDMSI